MNDPLKLRILGWTALFVLLLFLIFVLVSPWPALLFLLLSFLVMALYVLRHDNLYRLMLERLSQRFAPIGRLVEQRRQQKNRPLTPGFEADHCLISRSAGAPASTLISADSFVIGRGRACDLALPAMGGVSKEHCRISYKKHSRQYMIEDLRSTNGTYLGTKRLEPFVSELLLDNSEINLPKISFRFVRVQADQP